jgi:hypothetical protein
MTWRTDCPAPLQVVTLIVNRTGTVSGFRGLGLLDRIEFLNPLERLQVSRPCPRKKAPGRWLYLAAVRRRFHLVSHLRVEDQEFGFPARVPSRRG